MMLILPKMSALHKRGVWMMTLIVLAESVSVSDNVSCWKAFEGSDGSFDRKNECREEAPNALFQFFQKRSLTAPKPLLDPDCYVDCAHCIEGVTRKISRGGFQAPVTATEATAIATPYNIPLYMWKLIFQVFLTALNVACWLIPLKAKSISENKTALSLANAFSGGVFLSLAFGHLIPESVHGFDPASTAPYLLVLAGYLVIFFVEKVAFDAHDIMHQMEESTSPQSSGRSAVILLGALAVHSILEMMALGLADSFGDSALLTLSISLHQPAESIALLVAFLKSGLSTQQIIGFLSVFSCMGPIGVILGIAVNEYAAPIVDSIMLAIVAGTFVYVGATEVIPEEWEDSTNKWPKFAALISGIVSILAITQYTMTLGE